MAQYKTVAGPVDLIIEADADYNSAVEQYAVIINREAAGGWKLDCIQQISVTKKPETGCLTKLLSTFGLVQKPQAASITFNMLIFVKED